MKNSQLIEKLAHEMQYHGDGEVICQEIGGSKLGDYHRLHSLSTKDGRTVLLFDKNPISQEKD